MSEIKKESLKEVENFFNKLNKTERKEFVELFEKSNSEVDVQNKEELMIKTMKFIVDKEKKYTDPKVELTEEKMNDESRRLQSIIVTSEIVGGNVDKKGETDYLEAVYATSDDQIQNIYDEHQGRRR